MLMLLTTSTLSLAALSPVQRLSYTLDTTFFHGQRFRTHRSVLLAPVSGLTGSLKA